VRDKNRFPTEGIYKHPNVSLFEVDFLKEMLVTESVKDIDAAYYLIHSMSTNVKDFWFARREFSKQFYQAYQTNICSADHYLGGITNKEKLSKHLASEKELKRFLRQAAFLLHQLRRE